MSSRKTKTSLRFSCTVFALSLLGIITLAAPTSAQTCLQDEFKAAGNSQTLGCTANDVKVAQAVNIRDPQTGLPLKTCYEGTTFNFLADFEIVTSSTSSRSNIGLYFATQNQANALTGLCVDNIISPQHSVTKNNSTFLLGSDDYRELDPQVQNKVSAPDNCGDTSSTDVSPVFGPAAEGVTIEVDNFLCAAPAGQTGTPHLVLPNCTSWQVPGKELVCYSQPTSYPYDLEP